MRRDRVERIELDERAVDLGGILIPPLLEIELAELAIDAILVGAVAVRREVFADDVGSTEIRETETRDLEGVLDSTLLGGLVLRIEVVAARYLVVEQREILVQGLLVKVLLVQRPAELVERELVVFGGRSDGDDGRVGILGVTVFLAGEEVFGAAELDFIDVAGARIRGDELLHDFHGFSRAPEFVIRAGLLVQHLVAIGVVRILFEQRVVQFDGFERTRFLEIAANTFRHVESRRGLFRNAGLLGHRTLFECALGFRHCGRLNGVAALLAGSSRIDLCSGHRRGQRRVCGRHTILGSDLDDLSIAENAVLLLQLQIRKPPHRFRRHRIVGSFIQEAAIALHRLVEAVLDRHFRRIRRHPMQTRERPVLFRMVCTGAQHERGCHDCSQADSSVKDRALHGRAPAASACAFVARS